MLHPGFHKALAYLASDNLRSLLVDLVDISSPTGSEISVAQYLMARMRRIGMETDLPLVDAGRPNAVGHRRGRGHGLNLLFTGHMDTSYSGAEEHLAGEGFQFKAIYRDGWVWGLGANNMKSGLAAALSATVVDALGKARQAVTGEPASFIIRRPGADAVHLTAYGVPCIIFGPGGRMHPDARGVGMHAFGEHVLVEDCVTAKIYLALALDLCSRKAA